MEYNTSRTKLIYKEYGRNIQKLIEHAVTIEDVEKRNFFAKRIIGLMAQINPQLTNLEDYKHRLWDHLFLISGFKLEVDSPYPIPTKESFREKPKKLAYPKGKLRFRHYGKNVVRMIEKASVMEDEQMRKEFTRIIANYMKMVYRNRNEVDVNDEIIKRDLESISQGKLRIEEGQALRRITVQRRPSNSRDRDNNHRGKKRRGSSNHKSNKSSHHKSNKRRSYRQHGK